MKVVQINSVCGCGSTGKICKSISELLAQKGIENYVLHTTDGCNYSLAKQYMLSSQVIVQAAKAKVFGNYGFQSKRATKKLIRLLDSIMPDVVQLHNLHGHNVHLGMLFTYLREKNIKVYWTFHDCNAFTSYCMYFDMVRCDKWMSECRKCPQRKKYSWFFDRSRKLYNMKKELLLGLDLTIITPSKWLASLVKQSFLKEHRIVVINNGINLSLFTPKKSDFRKKYGISDDKTIVLGVANKWEPRKGLDIFLRLAHELDDNRFQIILVGTSDSMDEILPSNIISIHRTVDQKELAEVYSAADYFVNPTREDNFPTVNIEALACGTPVITFNTGGSPEVVTADCGAVIQCDDFEKLLHVISGEDKTVFSEDACVKRASEFNQDNKFLEYIDLYLSDS